MVDEDDGTTQSPFILYCSLVLGKDWVEVRVRPECPLGGTRQQCPRVNHPVCEPTPVGCRVGCLVPSVVSERSDEVRSNKERNTNGRVTGDVCNYYWVAPNIRTLPWYSEISRSLCRWTQTESRWELLTTNLLIDLCMYGQKVYGLCFVTETTGVRNIIVTIDCYSTVLHSRNLRNRVNL